LRDLAAAPRHRHAHAEADRLRERFLGGKARRQVADAALLELRATGAEDLDLVRAEDTLRERVAAPREHAADAADVADVGADAEDHRRPHGRPKDAERPLGGQRPKGAWGEVISPGRARSHGGTRG